MESTRKVDCISRKDHDDKNLFVQETDSNNRHNLYSQIRIEKNKLICANESYLLTDICLYTEESKPCTLSETNEIVDIGSDGFK